MPATISARLLAAARQTYQITAPGPVPALPAGAPDCGYGTPNGYVSGPDAINAALVGAAPDGIIIAFRGTLPPDSLVAAPGLPGLVHRGFNDSLNSLWPLMQPEIAALAAANRNLPLYVTGHSKGGAVADLAAILCDTLISGAGLSNPIIVCTFAAARPGDSDFATEYNRRIAHSTRNEYADDIVPHLPPGDALRAIIAQIPSIAEVHARLPIGFEPVGDLHYFARGSTVPVGDSPLLQVRRIASLAETMFAFRFDQIVADHSIGPGSGYATAITGGI
jgi:hypothetical protein